MDTTALILTIAASLLSGLATGVVANIRDHKKELRRRVEKDLDDWKSKYYEALQELIEVKGELEETLLKLTHIAHHED
jgi:hypothetical protein